MRSNTISQGMLPNGDKSDLPEECFIAAMKSMALMR